MLSSISWKPISQATERHLPYGITQCYLPHIQVNVLCLNPRQAGTQLTYPSGMEGKVDLGGRSYTVTVYLSADSQPC